nr:hypothetical protein [uncultured Rhodopila sp.]
MVDVIDIIEKALGLATARQDRNHRIKPVRKHNVRRGVKAAANLVGGRRTAIRIKGCLIAGGKNAGAIIVPHRLRSRTPSDQLHVERDLPEIGLGCTKASGIGSEAHQVSGHDVDDINMTTDAAKRSQERAKPPVLAAGISGRQDRQHRRNEKRPHSNNVPALLVFHDQPICHAACPGIPARL